MINISFKKRLYFTYFSEFLPYILPIYTNYKNINFTSNYYYYYLFSSNNIIINFNISIKYVNIHKIHEICVGVC